MPDAGQTTLIRVAQGVGAPDPSRQVLEAVQEAVRGEYEVLGELGRNSAGVVVYLARQLRVAALVALRARPAEGSPSASGEMWLDVLRQLDASTPGPGETCLSCNQAVGSWDRYCGNCGADLTGAAAGGDTSPDQLLQAVREAAGERYEVIGEMDRSDGGGNVYFARERSSGKLTALRLRRESSAAHGSPQYSLGRTTVLKSVAESLGVSHGGPPPRPAPPVKPQAPVVPAAAAVAVPPSPPVTPAPQLPGGEPGILQRYALPIAIGAAVVVLIGLFAIGQRGGSSRSATADSTRVSTAAANPTTPASDSVRVTIGGSLPQGTTVTVDGEVVSPPTFSVAPGVHSFRAAAPGYVPATESLTLAAGQRMVWTPTIGQATAPGSGVTPRHAAPANRQAASSSGAPAGGPTAGSATRPPPIRSEQDSMLATLPTTTSNPTCASLFATLEWDRALPVCQREAASGNVASERTLGTLYDRGLGTELNAKQAVVWYQRASDAGDRVAQYRLAMLVRDGKGVKSNQKMALDLFRKSASQGDADAQSALGTAYERGDGVKRDYAQAVDWYQQAATQGHPGAAYRLGVLYAQGKGVAKSDSAAIAWWTKAAAEGEPAARSELAKRGRI